MMAADNSRANPGGIEHICRMMKRHGVKCTFEQFQEAVNITFHRYESQVYDSVHECMWKSLPLVFDTLAKAAEESLMHLPRVRLLDIGCGTGLSSTLWLQTGLGQKVSSITLVDTSREMLEKAQARLRGFGGQITIHPGTVQTLDKASYDVALTCSVLHHIPDLPRFLQHVARAVDSDGIYVHLQDPNGDYLKDEDLARRQTSLNSQIARQRPPLYRRAKNKLRRMFPQEDYISQTNRDLLAQNIISTPLTASELWMVTDIHVENKTGISLELLRAQLSDFRTLLSASYSFFGRMSSELPESLRHEEERLFSSGAMNGSQIAGVWHKSRKLGHS